MRKFLLALGFFASFSAFGQSIGPAPGGGGGSGTVTSVANPSVFGVTCSVASATTVPAITCTAGSPAIGTATGTSLSLSGGTVTGVPAPAAGTDAANKTYVDSLLQNFDIKNPANAATTGALTFTPSYSNGSSGVGATLSATLPGVLIVDGYTPAINDALLIKNQASTLTNGVYTVTTLGTIGINYVLTRRTDFNQTANILYGDSIPVLAGTVNANQQFTMNNQNTITVGTTAITFAQTSGGSQLTQGTGITITGNTIALTSPVVVANGGSNATTVAGARSSFGVDQRSQYGSTTVNLAVTDHYVTACNNNNSGCSTSTWNAAAVWTLPLHSTVNDGDTISIADDLGIVTPTNTLSLAPTTVNAINGSGQIAAGGSFTTASTTITMSQSPPPWLVAGSNVYDVTGSAVVGTVSSWSSTTLTLTTTSAINSTGAADVLLFSPNSGATSNKFTINAAFGAASCKLDATTQNWACYGSTANGAAGTLLIGQSNGAAAMTPASGDAIVEGSGAFTIVTVTPGGVGTTRRIPMTADALTQGFTGTQIAGKFFASSGINIFGSSTGRTALASANSGASNFTITIPAITDTLATLAGTQTWSAPQSFNSGDLILKGASSGTTTLNAAAAAGSTTITLPGGTTDFSATGGSNQVVKQASAGAAFTVGTMACANLSDAGLCVATVDGTTITNTANVISATSQSGFAGFKAGLYYLPLSVQTSQASGAVLSVTKTYCMSASIPYNVHIDEIYSVSGTAGTSNNQYAIYNNGTGARPGTLVIATGNVANNTAAPASLSGAISSTAISAGTYWFCTQVNDTTVRLHSYPVAAVGSGMLLGSATALNTANASTSQIGGISVAGTFGTWPNLTGVSWTEETTAVAALVGVHILSVP